MHECETLSPGGEDKRNHKNISKQLFEKYDDEFLAKDDKPQGIGNENRGRRSGWSKQKYEI